MSLSNPEGTFRKSQLEDVEDLLLLAGGTGFTPMVKLLSYALSNSPTLRYCSVLTPKSFLFIWGVQSLSILLLQINYTVQVTDE